MNRHETWFKSLKVAKKARKNTAQENKNIKEALDIENRSKDSKL